MDWTTLITGLTASLTILPIIKTVIELLQEWRLSGKKESSVQVSFKSKEGKNIELTLKPNDENSVKELLAELRKETNNG